MEVNVLYNVFHHESVSMLIAIYFHIVGLHAGCSIVSISATRKRHMRARWKNGLPSLASWQKYFNLVAESDFLMGRSQPSNGRAPFEATLDWLINETNMLKVIEGKYHD